MRSKKNSIELGLSKLAVLNRDQCFTISFPSSTFLPPREIKQRKRHRNIKNKIYLQENAHQTHYNTLSLNATMIFVTQLNFSLECSKCSMRKSIEHWQCYIMCAGIQSTDCQSTIGYGIKVRTWNLVILMYCKNSRNTIRLPVLWMPTPQNKKNIYNKG